MIDKELELNEQGHARRRFLKQAATVAWASPFIVTMMSRTAHAQPQCGVQALDGDLQNPGILCTVTAPCGTTAACLPDPTDPGVGNACFCQTPPG